MDYEFKRGIDGQSQAIFSMGHEIIGVWLGEELGVNLVQIDTLLMKINELLGCQCWEYRHTGVEFIVTMSRDNVEVRAALLDDMFDEPPDELDHYDQESCASCGLEDFQRLLLSWRAFTNPSTTR